MKIVPSIIATPQVPDFFSSRKKFFYHFNFVISSLKMGHVYQKTDDGRQRLSIADLGFWIADCEQRGAGGHRRTIWDLGCRIGKTEDRRQRSDDR
jgi:hypothetical protein